MTQFTKDELRRDYQEAGYDRKNLSIKYGTVAKGKDIQDKINSILKEPKNALIKQYKRIFELDNIDLEYTDDALDYIVDKTLEFKLGARGLRGTMETVMTNAMFNMPSEDIDHLTIDLDYVKKYLDD